MYRLCIGYVSVILYAGIEKDTRKIASSNRACMTVVSYRLLLGGVKFIRGYERACDSMLCGALFLPPVEDFGAVHIVLCGVMERGPNLREEWVLLCYLIPVPRARIRFVPV